MRTRKLLALGVALMLSGTWVLAGQEADGCEPVGDIRFICDLIGPEDLAVVPGDEWVVVSGNQEGGRIHLINVADRTTSVLFPTADRVERLDAATYPSCPGPLEAAELNQDEFRAHGLYLKSGEGDVHTLYVVHHGRRESIEVFELDTGAMPMTLAWVGCAVVPEGLRLNSVVALPEGGFAATSTSTGDVWEWSTAGGWSVIPGTGDTTPNGLEISPDGALAVRGRLAGREADAAVARRAAAAEGRGADSLPAGQPALRRRRRVDPRRGTRQLRDAGGDVERRRRRPRDAGGEAYLHAPAHGGLRVVDRGDPDRRRDLARDEPRRDGGVFPGAGVENRGSLKP